MMRTTLNLPGDIYEIARSVATSKGLSLGDAIAELVREGLRPANRIDTTGPFPCFVAPDDAEPITLEKTLAAEDEV